MPNPNDVEIDVVCETVDDECIDLLQIIQDTLKVSAFQNGLQDSVTVFPDAKFPRLIVTIASPVDCSHFVVMVGKLTCEEFEVKATEYLEFVEASE